VGTWILEQRDYSALVFDRYELLGYDASTIPDAIGVIDDGPASIYWDEAGAYCKAVGLRL
jgi:hypothetical protein